MENKIKLHLITTKDDIKQELEDNLVSNLMKIEKTESYEEKNDSKISPLIESQFVEFILLTIALTISGLITILAEHWLRKRENGILIDLSKDTTEISLIRHIPQNTLVIIDKNKKSTVHKSPKKEGFTKKILEKILLKKLGDLL